jgi:ribonucleoside-diphosphate reductase alpha subunit
MLMRVALSIHKDNLKEAFKCYKIMSEKYFTHASPTLFNMGTPREQAFSCFLLQMKEDSMSGIFDTIKDCALISKWAGGIGVALHKIRAKDSRIRGSNGVSDGLVPMLRVFNDTARYSNQSGRRAGSFAMYLEPWHADIEEFLMMKRNTGAEELRARDLFYAVWIPDLFMERVRDGADWTLMCPDECPGLYNVYGDEFKKLYERYEAEGRGRRTIPADKIWRTIIDSQIETGTPYITYKDAVNRKSNQKNLGVIQSSNLCNEIVEYTAPDEHAVCCLASVSLPAFLKAPQLSEGEKITVYTKNNCMYCSATKAYLKQLGITSEQVNVVNIEDEPEQRAKLIRKLMGENVIAAECDGDACSIPENPSFTVPQIWVGERYIGGYEQLLKGLRYDYDYAGLIETTKQVTRNLNKLIDYNYYPVPETETSNRRHRPIGVGVQGLADVFAQLHIPFDSEEALGLTARISEAMYLGATQASMDIARKRKKHVQEYRRLLKKISTMEKDQGLTEEQTADLEKSKEEANQLQREHFIYKDEIEKLPMGLAGAYSTFVGSPASEGKLQFDLWREEQPLKYEPEFVEEWNQLKEDIKKHGLRNSLLMAMMPTASTSQILGNNECIEPYTNNIYKRRVNAGEFTVINNHLITDLINLGIWNNDLKDKIIAANGSVQGIKEIPTFIRRLYQTVWEIKQRWLVDHAIVRSPYVCQTQSMNLFVSNPTPKVINAMHFYAWKSGLKTGIYYLRSLAKTQAQKFSIDLEKMKKGQVAQVEEEEEICIACSA